MRRAAAFGVVLVIALPLAFACCGRVRRLSLAAPGLFGMKRAGANLRVEPGTTPSARASSPRQPRDSHAKIPVAGSV
jgi:hypothetical protein